MRKALLAVLAGMLVAGAGQSATTKKPAKPKAKTVVYADCAKKEWSAWTWGDEGKGCGAPMEKKGGKAVFTVKACDGGWGSGATLGAAVDPLDAEGTTKIVIKMKATKGFRIVPAIDEKGPAPDFKGVNGSDGERWSAVEVLGTGKVKEYAIKLADMTNDATQGNKNGNKTFDVKGLGTMQFYFPPQGAGTVELYSIKFR
jgi:hypothetical protein